MLSKLFNPKLTLQTVLAILITTLATAAIVSATTIGNNISTDGTLTVTGQTTLNGNVGISTTSPSQKLSITGKLYTTGGIQFPDGSLQTAAASAAASSLAGQIAFYNTDGSTVSGTSTITILPSGYVGIGTTSPYAKLSVVGEVVAPYYTATSTTATSTFAGYSLFATGGAGFVGIGDAIDYTRQSPMPTLTIARAVNWDSINFDNIRDFSVISPTADGSMYSSFDNSTEATGVYDYGHLSGYQDRTEFSGSGTLSTQWSFYSYPTFSGGITSDRYGVYILNPGGAGTLQNNYGMYIATQTRGSTSNYAIYTNGTTTSRFGGYILLGGSLTKLGDNGIINGTAADGNSRLDYFSGKYFAISESDTERFRVTAGGNVGIGTTTPMGRFTIRGADGSDQTILQSWIFGSSGNEGKYNLRLKQTAKQAGVVGWTFDQVNNATVYSDVLTLDRGKVGIGTTTPTAQLQVTNLSGNATSTVEIGKTGQNKGSCLKMYDETGTVKYVTIRAGSFAISDVSCQ